MNLLNRGSNVKTETEITVTGIRSLYGSVKDGQLDCAIVSLREELLGDLRWIPLHSDELLAVVPLDLTWSRDDFPVEKFDGQEFLMPSGGFDMDILAEALDFSNAKGGFCDEKA